MTNEEESFISIGQKIKNAEQSQMFDKPSFKINNKAFACLFQNEMVFKLTGESHSDALSLDGSQPFQPIWKKSTNERMGSSIL
jgi:hypothetical protein